MANQEIAASTLHSMQSGAAATDQPSVMETEHRCTPADALPAQNPQTDDCPCGCNRQETQQRFDTMPDEELLYDLADLFKVFADTTRIKILFALMARRHARGRAGRGHRRHAIRGIPPATPA